ncbi:MAG TPA: hypothetical protein VFW40_06775 [Capsulimonadaceae bacterium]|nr:hypothetical protein [Capsulimonadaceae bacterium]
MKTRPPKALVKASRSEKERLEKQQLKEIQSKLNVPLVTYGPYDWDSRCRQATEAEWMNDIAASLRSKYAEANELWPETAQRRRKALDVAYPPGFRDDCKALQAGNAAGLETAIRFLEADPWFFGTGYKKADLIKWITRLDLSARDATRLQGVVLHAVDSRDRREFRSYCRLARKVDTPELRDALAERLIDDSEDVRRRARWVLDALGAFEKGPDDLRNKAWRFLTEREESRGNHGS